MEVAYASFCGFGNIIISGPKLHHDQGHGDGLVQYARAIQELLNIGIYMSLSILSPFAYDRGTDTDEIMGSLAPFARKEYTNGQDVELVMKKSNECESWDAWHMIRTVCKYNQRLSVGKRAMKFKFNQTDLNVQSYLYLLSSLIYMTEEVLRYYSPASLLIRRFFPKVKWR